jgi:lysophospholipase L1-like esterase
MGGNADGWRDRMRLLKPSVWLIHLRGGVNDNLQNFSAEAFAANTREISAFCAQTTGQIRHRFILLIRAMTTPTGAESVLRSYIVEIDRMIAELGVRKGPDFFTTFSTDKAKWYGSDPVHPSVEGVELMAELWAKTLVPPLQYESKN